jgi:hypothetical protein
VHAESAEPSLVGAGAGTTMRSRPTMRPASVASPTLILTTAMILDMQPSSGNCVFIASKPLPRNVAPIEARLSVGVL